jgi:hypothetical protein
MDAPRAVACPSSHPLTPLHQSATPAALPPTSTPGPRENISLQLAARNLCVQVC